jgi:hypothetical protein
MPGDAKFLFFVRGPFSLGSRCIFRARALSRSLGRLSCKVRRLGTLVPLEFSLLGIKRDRRTGSSSPATEQDQEQDQRAPEVSHLERV